MDWTAFWTGVGATATIVLVVLALVKYFRGRARVVVEVVRQDYFLPSSIAQILTYAGTLECSVMLVDHLKSAEPPVRTALEKLKVIESNVRLSDLGANRSGNTTWLLRVINRGHQQAEKLELQIPRAIESLLLYSNGINEAITGGTIPIAELRPGESVRIVSWSNWSGEQPQLLQASGKATMRFQKLIDSRVASFYQFLLSPIGFLIGIVFVASLSLLIVQGFLLFRMVSR
jgi:hypothetical protein